MSKLASRVIISIFLMLISIPAFATDLKFAQISDIHYSPNAKPDDKSFKLKYYTLGMLEEAINNINADKDIKFTLVTGDAADRPVKEHFTYIFQYLNNSLDKPWYYSLGNHDVGINGALTKEDQIKLLNSINKKGFGRNRTYYSFKPKRDMTFIALDATSSTKITSQGYLTPDELVFVDNTIKKAGKDVIVIFLHHPTAVPVKDSDHNIVNEFALKEILNKYENPILILGGHYHACKVKNEKNIVEVASPAIVSYPCAYRFIEIENKKDKTVFKITYKPISNQELQTLAKKKSGPKFYWTEGKESDRNATIVVNKNCKCTKKDNK